MPGACSAFATGRPGIALPPGLRPSLPPPRETLKNNPKNRPTQKSKQPSWPPSMIARRLWRPGQGSDAARFEQARLASVPPPCAVTGRRGPTRALTRRSGENAAIGCKGRQPNRTFRAVVPPSLRRTCHNGRDTVPSRVARRASRVAIPGRLGRNRIREAISRTFGACWLPGIRSSRLRVHLP